MRRTELAHVLRSAAAITGDPEILVIGSQAILGTYWEDDLPEASWMSAEVDVAFLDDPGAHKADKVDAAIGEGSEFHQMNAYYGQGVEVSTAVLPDGWRDRVVRFTDSASAPATAYCLDAHDLLASKLVAYREKDLIFAFALIEADLVDLGTLRLRLGGLPPSFGVQRDRAISWVEAAARKLERGW
jgi:hypothetical protein